MIHLLSLQVNNNIKTVCWKIYLIYLVNCLFLREISTLDPSCKMYDTIGRMFMLSPKDQIISDLKKEQDAAEEKIKGLENSKAFLERSMKDAENNLREMVQQRK